MKLFVWDLHGTLEQGNENAVRVISNTALEELGYAERFSDELNKELYGLKWYQYFERLLPEDSHQNHMRLQTASFDLANSPRGVEIIASHIKPAPNAIKVLDAINQTHDQVVISNTMRESVPIFMKALGMEGYFTERNALAINQHAWDAKRTKKDALIAYLGDRTYDEIVVIGDSDGDMEFAESVQAKGYLYAHPGLMFRSTRGHFQINDLAELLNEV